MHTSLVRQASQLALDRAVMRACWIGQVIVLCALKAPNFWQSACHKSRHGASHHDICMHQLVLQSMVTLLKAAHVDDT